MKDTTKGTRAAARGLLAATALVGVLHPLIYWRTYSGDAVIHLVFARNLLRGFPLRFNVGMTSSGETSMGFMLIVTAVMRIVGPLATLPIVKGLCGLCLYGTALATYRVGRLIGLRETWAGAAGCAFLLIPGNVYTGVSGMENVVFALGAVGFAGGAVRAGWFSTDGRIALREEVLLGLAAAALFWVRPEAMVVVAMLLAVRLVVRGWEGGTILVAAALSLAAVLYVGSYRHYAGEMPYGAGRARRVLSTFTGSWWVLGMPLSRSVALRLAGYGSVVGPAAVALVAAVRRRRLEVVALATVFFGVMALYGVDALPSVQFARYSVYAWPFGLVAAGCGLQAMWDRNWRGLRAVWVVALAAAFAATAGWETRLRWEDGQVWSDGTALAEVERAPVLRDGTSAALAHKLGLKDGEPARLAYAEVQNRYRLNDNFTVLSLDGITDTRTERYFCDGWVDHDGYLIDSGADFVMNLPNYNGDRRRWSLERLEDAKPGETLEHPGIRYTALDSGYIRVTRTLARAADRPGGVCPKAMRSFDGQ